jgi:hypothetical protein
VSDTTVWVATSRLDDGLRRLVSDACEHARVRPVFWSAGGPDSPGSAVPSLLVAALPVGQRTIPEDVALLASQSIPAAPLLLLCGEPLVRHSVALPGGRVTLLGQPLTREKISARIRMAVAGATDSGDGAAREDAGKPVRVRELRGREWWAGVIAREAQPSNAGVDAGELLPSVCKLGRHGVAGLAALNLAQPLGPNVLREAALGLAVPTSPERAISGLEAAVGSDAVALWFSTAAFQWSFYVPRSESEVWLYSPLRLPTPFRLHPGNGGSWRNLGAASGDVVVIAAGNIGAPAERAAGGELWHAAEGGGPAVLDYFEARLASETSAALALIVELR